MRAEVHHIFFVRPRRFTRRCGRISWNICARGVYLVLHAQLDGAQISTVGNAEADSLFELAVVDEKIHAPREHLHPNDGRRGAWFSCFLPEVGQL